MVVRGSGTVRVKLQGLDKGPPMTTFKHPSKQSSTSSAKKNSSQLAKKTAIAERGRYALALWNIKLNLQPSLTDMLSNVPKVVTTKDWLAGKRELKFQHVWQHVEELREKGKWSFRQPKKNRAKARNKTHWDYLLDEMAWMRTDFKEEGKLKRSMARHLAYACQAWLKENTLRPLEVQMHEEERPSEFIHDHIVMGADIMAPGDLMLTTESRRHSILAKGTEVSTHAPLAFLDMDNNTLFADESLFAYSVFPLYEPLAVDDGDVITEEVDALPIVQISRLFSIPTLPPERLTKGRLKLAIERHRMPMTRYDPAESHFFSKADHKETGPIEIREPPKGIQHVIAIDTPWQIVEEERLLQLAEENCFNWILVADLLNAQRSGKPRYSPKGCHEHWTFLRKLIQDAQHKSLELAASGLPKDYEMSQRALMNVELEKRSNRNKAALTAASVAMKNENRKKGSKPITLVEAFRLTSRRRELLHKTSATAISNARITNVHESHTDIVPNEAVMEPRQMIEAKFFRDQHNKQMQLMHATQMAIHPQLRAFQQRQALSQIPNSQHLKNVLRAAQAARLPSNPSASGNTTPTPTSGLVGNRAAVSSILSNAAVVAANAGNSPIIPSSTATARATPTGPQLTREQIQMLIAQRNTILQQQQQQAAAAVQQAPVTSPMKQEVKGMPSVAGLSAANLTPQQQSKLQILRQIQLLKNAQGQTGQPLSQQEIQHLISNAQLGGMLGNALVQQLLEKRLNRQTGGSAPGTPAPSSPAQPASHPTPPVPEPHAMALDASSSPPPAPPSTHETSDTPPPTGRAVTRSSTAKFTRKTRTRK